MEYLKKLEVDGASYGVIEVDESEVAGLVAQGYEAATKEEYDAQDLVAAPVEVAPVEPEPVVAEVSAEDTAQVEASV